MYVDTSSLVAYFLPEEKSAIAQKILIEAEEIKISRLTNIELISAFNKKVRMQMVSKTKTDEAFNLFQKQCTRGIFQSLNLTPAVFNASEQILSSTTNPLRALDAIHIGFAYEYKVALFSFDKDLLNTAEEFNIPTIEN